MGATPFENDESSQRHRNFWTPLTHKRSAYAQYLRNNTTGFLQESYKYSFLHA